MTDARILALLHGGDWACAFSESEQLARVCRQLAELLDKDLARKAEDIAGLARSDMRRASHGWAELAVRLRPHRPPSNDRFN